VFNIGGGELIAILIIALIVLGPDKLPDAVRRAGRLYGELRRMSSGFQAELREVLDEPMREVRSTTDLVKGTFTTSVYDHDLEAQAAEAKAAEAQAAEAQAAAKPPGEHGLALPPPMGPPQLSMPAPGSAPDRSLPPPPGS